jgi:hypothetical protein
VFEGLGCLPGEHKICNDDKRTPVVHACRKVPFALRKKLKEELGRMEKMDVITKMDEPTEWVSSLVIVVKRNGDLRICLDPRDLNKAIKREHFKLPTREERMSQFAGVKWFSKLDASSGFWQMKLDDASSRLCTFNTPEGRYRFLHLPYGILSAPEVYHKTIHMIFVRIPGVETMMDDIIVWRSTKEEHERETSAGPDTESQPKTKHGQIRVWCENTYLRGRRTFRGWSQTRPKENISHQQHGAPKEQRRCETLHGHDHLPCKVNTSTVSTVRSTQMSSRTEKMNRNGPMNRKTASKT